MLEASGFIQAKKNELKVVVHVGLGTFFWDGSKVLWNENVGG